MCPSTVRDVRKTKTKKERERDVTKLSLSFSKQASKQKQKKKSSLLSRYFPLHHTIKDGCTPRRSTHFTTDMEMPNASFFVCFFFFPFSSFFFLTQCTGKQRSSHVCHNTRCLSCPSPRCSAQEHKKEVEDLQCATAPCLKTEEKGESSFFIITTASFFFFFSLFYSN